MKIINKDYSISSKLNKKIVLISDLHYLNKKDLDRLNSILDDINNIKPNFICIPGDIIDKSKVDDENIFVDWVKRLSKVSTVIISIGNHELYRSKLNKLGHLNKEFYNKLSNIDNLYVLDNKNIIIDNINFIGITIPIEYYFKNNLDNFSNLLNKVNIDKKHYNVLLCHSPVDICNKDILKNKNIDLVLCGHMHGGVVPRFLRRIMGTNGFISPNKTLFPKNAYGHLNINNTDIIITSGCKVLPFKLLNKMFSAEVVTINLTFNKKNV